MISILAWNIRQGGGTRSAGILKKIREQNPTIVVLSEFRNNDNGCKLRIGLLQHGYLYQVASGASGNENTMLIASRAPCGSAVFPESDANYPHAIVRADFSAFRLYGLYLPHKKKHKLFQFLKEELATGGNGQSQSTIITGDWNTGKNGIDQAGNSFWYSEHLPILEKSGYVDAFRKLHGDAREYSWYSHQGNGYRYDHTYVDESLAKVLKECRYLHTWREEGLSDHSPMFTAVG